MNCCFASLTNNVPKNDTIPPTHPMPSNIALNRVMGLIRFEYFHMLYLSDTSKRTNAVMMLPTMNSTLSFLWLGCSGDVKIITNTKFTIEIEIEKISTTKPDALWVRVARIDELKTCCIFFRNSSKSMMRLLLYSPSSSRLRSICENICDPFSKLGETIISISTFSFCWL